MADAPHPRAEERSQLGCELERVWRSTRYCTLVRIARKKILPELLQKDVTIKNIIHSINSIRQKSSEFYTQKFNQIQEDLKAGGADKASLEVLKLLN